MAFLAQAQLFVLEQFGPRTRERIAQNAGEHDLTNISAAHLHPNCRVEDYLLLQAPKGLCAN
jgi:hypothetical protein